MSTPLSVRERCSFLSQKCPPDIFNQKFPITLLAKRLKKSRRYSYDVFEKQDVTLDLILRIGKIIQHDFSNDLKNLSKIPEEYQLEVITEPDISFEDVNYWKSKYFELL